jgi:hypothetical protein
MRKATGLRSTGTGLVLAALGLYASGWPEVIRLHPVIPLFILLAGAAVLVWSFYLPHEISDSEIGASIERDNFGQQMSAGRDIKTEHHYYSHNLEGLEKPREHTEVTHADDSTPRQLRLRIDEIEVARLKYEPDEGRWIRGGQNDRKGLLIWVTSDQAPVGQPNHEAKGLFALVQLFSGNRAYRASVPRAYWLETYGNQVDLQIGDRRAVIVGLDADDDWLSYGNGLTFRRLTHFEAYDSYAELPNPSKLPKGDYLRFVITLIEGKDRHSALKCAFQINFPVAGNWDAVPIEDSEL